MEHSHWEVIIVDDEPHNIGVLELILEFHGATVHIAESGEACLQLLDHTSASFLLVDIQMPEMTGYELLDRIRDRDGWREIPVIAVTAHAMSGDAERIRAVGFNGYIAKPINAVTLVDELQTILAESNADG